MTDSEPVNLFELSQTVERPRPHEGGRMTHILLGFCALLGVATVWLTTGCDDTVGFSKASPDTVDEWTLWEHINHYSRLGPTTFRTKTPTGWLVTVVFSTGGSTCFIPDPEHKWVIGQ